MIFVRGYIHCDPHPGNVLVRRRRLSPRERREARGREGEVEIMLLDHGLYTVRYTGIDLWLIFI